MQRQNNRLNKKSESQEPKEAVSLAQGADATQKGTAQSPTDPLLASLDREHDEATSGGFQDFFGTFFGPKKSSRRKIRRLFVQRDSMATDKESLATESLTRSNDDTSLVKVRVVDEEGYDVDHEEREEEEPYHLEEIGVNEGSEDSEGIDSDSYRAFRNLEGTTRDAIMDVRNVT
jgi:hypothetical protein